MCSMIKLSLFSTLHIRAGQSRSGQSNDFLGPNCFGRSSPHPFFRSWTEPRSKIRTVGLYVCVVSAGDHGSLQLNRRGFAASSAIAEAKLLMMMVMKMMP